MAGGRPRAVSPRRVGIGYGAGAFVRHVCATTIGVLTAWLVGGWSGLAAGIAAMGIVGWLLPRCAPFAGEGERLRAAGEMPVAVDLLAAALRAGVPPERAARVVGEALGGPIGARLLASADALLVGEQPALAWANLGDLPGADRLVRAAVRSSDSGAALAGALERVAGDLRAARGAAAEAAAHRVGVLVVLPLGLCFLPAFLLAGVVPVVVAVLGEVLRTN
jgi:pilus assembly protein TadC